MRDWSDIRDLARSCRRKTASMEAAIDAVVAKALDDRGLTQETIAPRDGFGPNVRGAMERSGRTIFTAGGLSDAERRFVTAHELGHHILHDHPLLETTLLSYAGEAGLAEGYSVRSLVEVQADVFASEFLCPTDWLKEKMTGSGMTPATIAADLGLPYELVLRQAIRARLHPNDHLVQTPRSWSMPATAVNAARVAGHALVEGAPGSGKTTACMARVAQLIVDGIPPAAIAVICQDEDAARRFRACMVAAKPETAQAWIGSLRGFALEVVSVCASRIDRTQDFKIADEAAALTLVAAALDDAGHRAGATEAAAAHRSIRRCKKARLGPNELAGLARDIDSGEVSRLVRVWGYYEARLAASDMIDGTDLSGLAHRALESPEVCERSRRRFAHLVVDDFETLCRADHALLRRFAAIGTILFAAGDASASIHRFHGAQPEALSTFEADYPGAARIRLDRSRCGPPAIEDAITCFGGQDRPDRGGRRRRLAMSVAPTIDGEAAAIARRIETLRAAGFAYRDQAILTRSHGMLADLAERLAALGVPVSHLGDLRDRPEVGDLMAVASLVKGTDAAVLERVATLSVYGARAADAAAVMRHARARGIGALEALGDVERIEGLAADARVPLGRLARDLAGFGPLTPPWTVLTGWLFERSDYLATLGGAAEAHAKRHAIRLVLDVCDEQNRLGDLDLGRLAVRIERLRSLDQETSHRLGGKTDEDGTDSVTMITIHAAKGRRFEVVHLPGLAAGRLPVERAPAVDPLRDLDDLSSARARRDDEERAIFAIALTRARSHLHLSRAERYPRRLRRERHTDELGLSIVSRGDGGTRRLGRHLPRSRFIDELGPIVIERRVQDDGLPAPSRRA